MRTLDRTNGVIFMVRGPGWRALPLPEGKSPRYHSETRSDQDRRKLIDSLIGICRMAEFEYPNDMVPHPRFGVRSIPSGFDVPRELIRAVYCYDRPPVFPESAIPADISRQNYSVVPRACYVDWLRTCHCCDRPFIFFAREQQYWYEELGFWVDAQCLHCPECRRSHHRFRRACQRFSETVSRGHVSHEELTSLIQDTILLYENGTLRSENKLRRIKNLALAQRPGSEVTKEIAGLVASLRAKRRGTG